MADLPHRRHGNFPQRRATLLPQGAKRRVQLARNAKSPETGSNLATAAAEPSLPGEPLGSTRFCGVEMEPNGCWRGKTKTAERAKRRPTLPEKGVSALLKRIRIHPQAQRILGNSCIAIVCLERLRIQVAPHRSVSLSALQPVVSLVRLACQPRPECHGEVPRLDPPEVPRLDPPEVPHLDRPEVPRLDCPLQNGSSQTEEDGSEIGEVSSPSRPAGSFDFSPGTKATSWTEPYCPDSSPSVAQEPEQDSGFDCESNPDPPYILFESESEWDSDVKNDSESFYLDPDPEQHLVIQLDPEPESSLLESGEDTSLELHYEPESKCEVEIFHSDDGGDGSGRCSPTQQEPDRSNQQPEPEADRSNQQPEPEADRSNQQPEPEAGIQERESEDFCAVCLNGGDLLCCDRCPKVYHLACHIPPLTGFPLGDWVCTLCRTDQDPVEAYDRDSMPSCGGMKAPYTLSTHDQRRCEQLTLLLSCHILSAPFHEPVSPLARNYYQIIRRPVDLSVVRRKLDKSNTLHYFTAEQFVDDVLLMFKNCATFNYPDSEVAQAGRSLEVFFLGRLEEVFPDRTFPTASQDRTDRARLQWLNRKRKENCRKKRYVFSGKKYLL